MHEDREAPHPVRRTGSPFLRALVLLPRSQAAADVALGLVLLHYRLDLQVQRAVIQRQPLRQVLVFRRDELERFRPSPNLQANAGKYPHSHPYPLRFSG